MPAVIRRDESVLTPGQMRAMGGPQSVKVEITNNGTPQRVVSAQPRFDASGMVISLVTEDLRGNGPIAQAMTSTFNLGRGGR
jgi:hypothetical protein